MDRLKLNTLGHLVQDRFQSFLHGRGGVSSKRQSQDVFRRHAMIPDQIADPMGHGQSFAASRDCKHGCYAVAEAGRSSLLFIELRFSLHYLQPPLCLFCFSESS